MLYHGPVRVPEEAGSGKAKVTFSFDAWKEGKVAPSTVELPIETAAEKPALKDGPKGRKPGEPR